MQPITLASVSSTQKDSADVQYVCLESGDGETSLCTVVRCDRGSTKGPFIRPRCIGAARSRTLMQSINRYDKLRDVATTLVHRRGFPRRRPVPRLSFVLS
jgi:hypothetical protein